jgi:hypothetical protein
MNIAIYALAYLRGEPSEAQVMTKEVRIVLFIVVFKWLIPILHWVGAEHYLATTKDEGNRWLDFRFAY